MFIGNDTKYTILKKVMLRLDGYIFRNVIPTCSVLKILNKLRRFELELEQINMKTLGQSLMS